MNESMGRHGGTAPTENVGAANRHPGSPNDITVFPWEHGRSARNAASQIVYGGRSVLRMDSE
ncbi:MAG: hypothetical protein Tsb002_38810 [Wenzhouxiangellaceae bacterium]